MSKVLDLQKTVFELCTEYPELPEIMAGIGFEEITKPMAMQTMGRIMTIPKGAKIKGIDLDVILETFREHGFEIVDKVDREALLKSYIQRLSAGEDLESVRKDFVANFKDVDAMEIAKAEQTLIQEGTPVAEVTKLCDVHSALFHGATKQEQIANAEAAVAAGFQAAGEQMQSALTAAPTMSEGQIMKQAAKMRSNILMKTKGHPLYTFTEENRLISRQIAIVRAYAGIPSTSKMVNTEVLLEEDGQDITAGIQRDMGQALEETKRLRALATHYAKKGDLIYPVLSSRYDISGPADVMWSVDDEIRDALRAASAFPEIKNEAAWLESLDKVLTRAEEMVYKENNILFPMCAHNFRDQEWLEIYRDSQDYDLVLMEERIHWSAGEEFLKRDEDKRREQVVDGQQEVVIPGGHMTLEELSAMLNTIPMEISFVDRQDINRYFNEGPKLFKRAEMAIDRDVFSCHPPKIEPMVRAILADLRNGSRDSVDVWMEKAGTPVLIRYMAVRDRQGQYLGCLEVIQDMSFAKKHFEK